MTTVAEKQRYSLLDGVRGLALVNMIAYHGLWDLVYLEGVPLSWYEAAPGFVWQQCICWTFILLSGFCWDLSRSPWKNGVIVSAAGALVTLVTVTIMPEAVIWCGVLSFLGMAMLLMIPLKRLLCRCQPLIGLLVSMGLFVLTRSVQNGYLLFCIALPEWLYQSPIGFVFGFPMWGFYSADYFPLLPWMFLYIAGYFLHRLAERHRDRLSVLYRKIPVLDTLGRHSLLIYLAHQPVLYVVICLIPAMVG